jgi:hypothetical protein
VINEGENLCTEALTHTLRLRAAAVKVDKLSTACPRQIFSLRGGKRGSVGLAGADIAGLHAARAHSHVPVPSLSLSPRSLRSPSGLQTSVVATQACAAELAVVA